MAHYLDPKNYLVFKRVFGEHKYLCMSLINSMLPLEKPVIDIEYETSELVPEIPALHNSIINMRCVDADKRQFIVKMQLYWSEAFMSRVLLNASKPYVRQLDKSRRIELRQPVYVLNFVNEIFEKSPEKKDVYYHYYPIVKVKDTEEQIRGLEFIFVELPKFKPTNRAEKEIHELWMRFLTAIDKTTENVPPELLDNQYTREAVGYTEESAYTKKELDAYDQLIIDILTVRSMFIDARKEGIRKGIQERMAKGKVEGIQEGMAKGKLEIAKAMKQKGIPLNTISEITGLAENEIDKL